MNCRHLETIAGETLTAVNLWPQKTDGWVIVKGIWTNNDTLTCPRVARWDRTKEQAMAILRESLKVSCGDTCAESDAKEAA